MPGVLDISSSDPEPSPRMKAESVKLWLPSQLDAADRDSICLGGVVKTEKEFRFAQLEDALDDLCRARRVRRGLVEFHKVQLAGEGQKTQTKSRAVMQTVQDRITKAFRRYNAARNALLCLDPCGGWQVLYPPLTQADNRGPGKEQDEISDSDGKYSPSWIWHNGTTTISHKEVNEDMRVEWAQCIARADRWEEEVTLLQEEMRRVVQFLEWKSRDWFAKVDSRAGTVIPAVHAGLSAYARKEGSVFHTLATRFSQRWRSVLISLSLPHVWATMFLETHEELLENPDFKKRQRANKTPSFRACTMPPPPTPTSVVTPPPTTTPETIEYDVQLSDVDPATSSEDDGSEYESASSSDE
jgi:hypothetical protein